MPDNDIISLYLEKGELRAKKGYNSYVIPEKLLGFENEADTLKRISLLVCGVFTHIYRTEEVDKYLSKICRG